MLLSESNKFSCVLFVSICKLLFCWLVYKQINKRWQVVNFTICSLNDHDEIGLAEFYLAVIALIIGQNVTAFLHVFPLYLQLSQQPYNAIGFQPWKNPRCC